MTDLTFNVVALDRASATFVKMAQEVERLQDRLDKLDRKDVTVDVNIKTNEADAAIGILDTRFKRFTAGITAGAPLAGAAIVGGVGAGFISLAALANKSNEDVRQSYRDLWSGVVSETQAATAQVIPQLTGVAGRFDAAFQGLGPELHAAFAPAGADLNILAGGMTDFATGVMPGVTSAMQHSEPVFTGVALALDHLGDAGSTAFTSVGQHAEAYGRVVQSAGNIADTALTGGVGVVNALADSWQQNAGAIDGAVAGLGTVVSGLATGGLPVLAAGLGSVADAADHVLGAIGPLSPVLGAVGGTALTAWVGLKGANAAAAGIRGLGTAVADMGTRFEQQVGKMATGIASLQGVTTESSALATGMRNAAGATGNAATGFGLAATRIAGPLSYALLGGITLWSLFSGGQDSAAEAEARNRQALEDLTTALQNSNGAVDDHVLKTVKTIPAFDEASKAVGKFGISADELASTVAYGGKNLDDLRARLNMAAHATADQDMASRNLTQGAQEALSSLAALSGAYQGSIKSYWDSVSAQHAAHVALLSSKGYQDQVSSSASALGLSLNDVSIGFMGVLDSGKVAATDLQGVSMAFLDTTLAVGNAQAAVADHWRSVDQAVVSAKASVSDAQHQVASSARSMADAQYGVVQAQRAVQQADEAVAQAHHGVEQAQLGLVGAQERERQAQQTLHDARRQAIADLKALRDQLDDQQVTEQQARVRLFDAAAAARAAGVDSIARAKNLATAKITGDNEPAIKAALDLLSAQDSLNETLKSGVQLRQSVTDAERRGVEGSKGVQDAQRQLKDAHQAVTDASYQLTQAHEGLKRAEQGVSDAAHGLAKAQQGVTDAQYQQTRSAEQLATAQKNLTAAQAAASRTLDSTTVAGRANLGVLKELWDAIIQSGLPAEDRYSQLVSRTAKALGISTTAAAKYLKQLGLIPDKYSYKVTAVADADLKAITKTKVNGVEIFSSSLGSGGIASAPRLAVGGPVVGTGGPRSDSNLIWASHGEYMQPADTVQHYGVGFMDAVRKKQFPRFADGGLVEAIAAYTNLSTAYVADVNALQVMGLPHPKQLPNYVAPTVAPFTPGIALGGFAGSRAANRATVLSVFGSMFGWHGASETAATDYLLTHESGYNNLAQNPTSTAFGMFQFLDSTWAGYGVPKTADPRAQSVAGGRYIQARYGDPIGAAAFWSGHHWYDQGGYLMPGYGVHYNGTGGPEMVLPREMTLLMEDFARTLYGGHLGNSPAASRLGTVVQTSNTDARVQHFHLTVVNAQNSTVDLEAQFARMMDNASVRAGL